MALQLGKDLLAQTGGDLGVNLGVLDVLMPEVIGHIFNALAGFQEVHGNGVTQAVNGAAFNPCLDGIVGEGVLPTCGRVCNLTGPVGTTWRMVS